MNKTGRQKNCLTCNVFQSTKGGSYSEEDDLFQCKTCIMKDIKCLDCGRIIDHDQSLIFNEGKGTYWALCRHCLAKSYDLLLLLKDQKKKACKNLIKRGFEIAEKVIDEEIAEEDASRPPKPPPPPKPVFFCTDEEKTIIQNACELILGVEAQTLIIGGRDGCQEHLKFQTSDYEYEFQIGCHNAVCTYIEVYHTGASFDISVYRDNRIELCWHGKSYDLIPVWIPWEKMHSHCTEIIRRLQIKNCDKKFH